MLSASVRLAPNETVTRLPGRTTAKAPPVAELATKSAELVTGLGWNPAFSRQALEAERVKIDDPGFPQAATISTRREATTTRFTASQCTEPFGAANPHRYGWRRCLQSTNASPATRASQSRSAPTSNGARSWG